MHVVRWVPATAVSVGLFALVMCVAATGCSKDQVDCHDADGKYENQFLGCRGNARAECHVEYRDCDWERCRTERVSIHLTRCPSDRPMCQDQRDVNGPTSVCHVADLDKTCGNALVVDGKSFVPDVIADLDGDGRSDLLRWGTSDAEGVTIAIAGTDGSFRRLPPIAGDYSLDAWLADVDGDGKLDLVTTRYTLGATPEASTTTIVIAAGRGDGTFDEAVDAPPLGDRASPVAVVDVDGDERADIVSWDRATKRFTVLRGAHGPLVRSPPGTFTCTLHDCPGSRAERLAAGDLNQDHFGDLVLVGPEGRLVTVLGTATGLLEPGPVHPTLAPQRSPRVDTELADFDADGRLDVVTWSQHGVWIHPGNGDATFRAAIEVTASPYEAGTFSIADVDGDGMPDLLFADRHDVVIVRRNSGAFTFAPAKFYQPGPNAFGFLGVLTPAPGVAPSLVAGPFVVPASCR